MKSDYIEISDELFLEVGKLITGRYGIKMPPDKKIMFQARLQKRLRELHLRSFGEYVSFLFDGEKTSVEFDLLADYISTNKTEFFREKEHFRLLNDMILPEYLKDTHFASAKKLEIWSAGCSNGQEAYSVAIQLEEFMRQSGSTVAYSILATDISKRMLRQAKEAVYSMQQADDIPFEMKQRYLLKSKNQEEKKVRIIKELRDKVVVAYLNLMDSAYPFKQRFDMIFLRNTLIYFEPHVQVQVLTRILDCLKPGGYLFIGHSESLINLKLPIKPVAPSIYVKLKTERNEL